MGTSKNAITWNTVKPSRALLCILTKEYRKIIKMENISHLKDIVMLMSLRMDDIQRKVNYKSISFGIVHPWSCASSGYEPKTQSTQRFQSPILSCFEISNASLNVSQLETNFLRLLSSCHANL